MNAAFAIASAGVRCSYAAREPGRKPTFPAKSIAGKGGFFAVEYLLGVATRTMKTSFLYSQLLVALLTLSACRRSQPPPPGVGVWGPTSYTFPAADAGKRPLPGVEQGSIAMGLCYQGATAVPAFAVWVGEGGGGTISGRTEVLTETPLQRVCAFTGTLAGVSVECQTTDAKTGTIKIAGEAFQLEQGALFLVVTTAAKPVIKQMPFARLNLKPETYPSIESLRALAGTGSDMRAFWQPQASAK